MELVGLAAAQLAYVFGGIGALLVALHMVKRRRETRVVPFIELYARDMSEARRSTWIARYLAWLSLLLLLAIAGLLVFALGDPRRTIGRNQTRTLALWVDVSRSMGTREAGGTRLDLAKKAARAAIRGLREGDRAAIIAVSSDPEARTALTDDRAVLLRALDELAVEDVHDDFRRAAELTNDILATRQHPEVIVFSDGANVDEGALDVLGRRIVLREKRIGRARGNVGIRAFSLRRYPRDRSQSEILVSLENDDTETRRYELILSAGGRTIDVRALELGPRATHDEVLRHIAGAAATFEATIRPVDGKPDALTRDDHAYATLPERRRIRTLVVSVDNLFLDAALLLDEAVEPTTIAPAAYTSSAGYDVVIFDGYLPDAPPVSPALLIHPAPRDGAWAPFTMRGERATPTITRVERDDPLLAGIDIDSVNIERTPQLVPVEGDRVLASAGSVPLLIRGDRDGVRFIALSYDARASDLPMRMAWPVLLVRSLEQLAGATGDIEESFRTDRVARIPIASEARRVRIVDPRGQATEVPVVNGVAIYRPRQIGFFRVHDGASERVLAASLGPASEISIRARPLERSSAHPRRFRPGRATASARPWTWLVLTALGLVCLEWWTHHRRWTA